MEAEKQIDRQVSNKSIVKMSKLKLEISDTSKILRTSTSA